MAQTEVFGTSYSHNDCRRPRTGRGRGTNRKRSVMRFMKCAAAVCAVAGAVAAFSPAAAVASAGDPCVQNPNLPTCVNDAFDRALALIDLVRSDPCVANVNLPACVNDGGTMAIAALETVRTIYNNDIRPLGDAPACQVYERVTGKPCPGLLPML